MKCWLIFFGFGGIYKGFAYNHSKPIDVVFLPFLFIQKEMEGPFSFSFSIEGWGLEEIICKGDWCWRTILHYVTFFWIKVIWELDLWNCTHSHFQIYSVDFAAKEPSFKFYSYTSVFILYNFNENGLMKIFFKRVFFSFGMGSEFWVFYNNLCIC